MTIKELFEKAENGTLTWEQFQAAAGESKFVDLKEGNYVSRQKHDSELSTLNTRITELNGTIETRDADLATLQQKLNDAGDIEALKGAAQELANLKTKYDAETKDYQARLSKQAYEFAVKDFANEKSFSSKAAKRDFEQWMISRNLTMENGKIIGAEDSVQIYAKDNPDAFVVKTDPKPKFVDGGQTKDNDKPSLTELMKLANANPDARIDI